MELVVGALNGEEGCAGREGDFAGSVVVELEPLVVNGVEMIDADDEVGGDDGFSGFAVEHEDGDGGRGLRAKGKAERGGKGESKEGASHERAQREVKDYRSQHILTLSRGAAF